MSSPASAEFPAWGGRAVVAVGDPGQLELAVNRVQDVIAAVDQACSSFRDDSELAVLNRAGGAPVPVSPLLLGHLEAGLRAAEVTGGDLDPTVGEALVAYGFTAESPGGPGQGSRYEIRAVPGHRTISLDRAAGTARLAKGVRVDLGATAKALAADQAAAAAHEATGAGVLVSLSGDLSTAGAPPDGGWRVRVTDDHRSDVDAPGQWISLSTGGLATSSTTVRARDEGHERIHHVIDPHTGAPARVVFRTISVAAASCLDANIASTAAIVRGESAVAWLAELHLAARLVRVDGTAVHVSGWPSEGEDLERAPSEALEAAR